MKRIYSIIAISSSLGVFTFGSIIGASIYCTLPGKNNTRFIAHRGLSSQYMQNTLKAFEAASGKNQIWGIETDVWKTNVADTNDYHFICSHDANPFWEDATDMQDTATLKNWTTADETREIPMSHSSYKVPDEGRVVPTFKSYLEACRFENKRAVIELKQPSQTGIVEGYTDTDWYFDEDDINAIIDLVDDMGMLNQATFISFDHQELQWVKDYMDAKDPTPVVHLQQLVMNEKQLKDISGLDIKGCIDAGYDVSLAADICNSSIVKYAHNHGREVGVWGNSSVDYPTLWDVFKNMGIDFITSDWLPNYN